MVMPRWLAAQLEDDEHGVPGSSSRTRAKARHCKVCRAVVLVGDAGGIVWAVDAEPVNHIGEALAVLTGRRTFNLYRRREGLEISGPRDQFQIKGSPAGTRTYDVLASHLCYAGALPAAVSVYESAAAITNDPDAPCPF